MTAQSIRNTVTIFKRSPTGKKPWYLPTFSPEHGVLIILIGAVITGAALAQHCTGQTNWACLAVFLALQAEHPLVVQIKRRRQWRLRYVVWAGLYGGSALAIALWLTFQHPVLMWICGVGAIALGIDLWAVFNRQHKSTTNEMVMFSALCLATPFVYGTTVGEITPQAMGLWALNSLFFCSTIFGIKMRKSKNKSSRDSWVFCGSAIALVALLYLINWLSLFTALTFSIALLRFLIIHWQKDWYCNCHFGHVARFETYFALTYSALVALTVLPPKLPVA